MLQDFFTQLTSFVSGLYPWQQVLALVPAGAIPFVESYLGSFLGTLVGKKYGGQIACDELGLPVTASGLNLPCGSTGRWFR